MEPPTNNPLGWRAARRDHRRAVVVTAGVALFLLTPGSSLPDLPGPLPQWLTEFGDKIVHALLFFVETLALGLALRHHYGRRATVLAIALAGTYALFTELVQLAIPFRDGSVGDLLADAVGIALALPLIRRWIIAPDRDAMTAPIDPLETTSQQPKAEP